MDGPTISIRRATEWDQSAIRALVRGERLNPHGLSWPNFLVAANEDGIIGAVQMRRNADGSRELGSLVVSREVRGRGIGAQLIDALLASEHEPVWMITSAAFAKAYARWGFQPIDAPSAPVKVRRNYRMGSLAGIVSILKLRPLQRLVILERLSA